MGVPLQVRKGLGPMAILKTPMKRFTPTSTVGRGRAVRTIAVSEVVERWADEFIFVRLGDSLDLYSQWEIPTVIVSDGGYGVLGFEGDTSDHLDLPAWYEPHVAAWARYATPGTTLWFWNSEIGWAAVHPILEKHGWRYVNANIWNKGKGHIAGNVNTGKIPPLSCSFGGLRPVCFRSPDRRLHSQEMASPRVEAYWPVCP